ncbi:MAG: anaerobic dehydrogenase [Acidimicrobiia bacterium]|nr:anaerobic dehydrogenase [Acidimicrobiia bacterium]
MSTQRPSICRLCNNGCPIVVDVDDDRVIRVTGDRRNPVYGGYTCVKGRAQPQFLSHPDRLLHSLKRQPDGSFAPIASDRAMDEIAERIARIVEDHGASSVAGYWGTMVVANILINPVLDAFLKALGSPNEYSAITIDKPGKIIARALHGSWMAPRQGFDQPDVALLIGINPLVSYQGAPVGNPGRWLSEAKKRGMALIVIDPRRSDVAKRATIHLQARPGHDAPLLASMIKVILSENLYDREFVDHYVAGLDTLREAVRPFSPAVVAAAADVDADDLVQAARIFAGAARGYATPGTGPSMSGPGTLVEYLVLCLETLCGHWLRAGERVRNPGVLLPTFSAKAQPSPPTAGYDVGQPMRVRGLSRSAAGLPTAALPDEILLPGDGQIRALISSCGNPATAWPDQDRTLAALNSLDLLVQVDPWMSQTAQLAHYVIAPPMPLEVPASSIGFDFQSLGAPAYGAEMPLGQYTDAIVSRPPGSDLVEEWEFFYGLAQRLRLKLEVSSFIGKPLVPFSLDMVEKPSSAELLELISTGSRIPLSEVKRFPSGAAFDEPAVYVAPADADCAARLDVGNADMMQDLAHVAGGALRPGSTTSVSNGDRPGSFSLLCRRSTHVYNSSHNHEATNHGRPYNPAFLHPDDITMLGLTDGDLMEITSTSGSILAVTATDGALRRGVVSMSVGFGDPDPLDDVWRAGSSVNRLLSAQHDYERYSGQPLMSNVPVTIRPQPTKDAIGPPRYPAHPPT